MDSSPNHVILEVAALAALFRALQEEGYATVGPTVRDQAIVYEEIESPAELPIGWTEEQDAGSYRLKRRDDDAHFGFTVGPHSWKKFLHPPRVKLFGASRGDGEWSFEEPEEPPRYALIGVRSCELHAIAIQDRVFLGGPHVDRHYQDRRQPIFIVAVNCAVAARTCFCVSMNTGPKVRLECDLQLTEVLQSERHYFVCEAGTEAGRNLLAKLAARRAEPTEIDAAEEVARNTAASMGRSLDAAGVKELLYASLEHPRWDEVASRCLSCANCTMVCPTCFCTTVEEVTDLTGDHAERWRRWDSCFTMDFTQMHGGSARQSAKSRYRQWLTHKLATWHDQFETSGCVGCGRCITWCPVGIDLTEEVRVIRETQAEEQAS